MSLGGLIQVSRVFAPSGTNGKTRKSAAATTGTTGQNILTAITKISANCAEGAVVFVADQDGRLAFGASAVTATAAAGIPIAARVPYVVWVHREKSNFFSYYNSSATNGGIEYWDPEKP